MRKTILLILVLLTFWGCKEEPCPYHCIYIKNKSNNTIYYYCNLVSYPDTVAKTFSVNILKPEYDYDIAPEKKRLGGCLEEYNDTIMIYIYNNETLKKHTLQEIYENHMVAARYDLSIDDVRNLNYKIPYPPTEDMSEMKIYIPK